MRLVLSTKFSVECYDIASITNASNLFYMDTEYLHDFEVEQKLESFI